MCWHNLSYSDNWSWFVRKTANNFLTGQQELGREHEAAKFFFSWESQGRLCETACEMKLKRIVEQAGEEMLWNLFIFMKEKAHLSTSKCFTSPPLRKSGGADSMSVLALALPLIPALLCPAAARSEFLYRSRDHPFVCHVCVLQATSGPLHHHCLV